MSPRAHLSALMSRECRDIGAGASTSRPRLAKALCYRPSPLSPVDMSGHWAPDSAAARPCSLWPTSKRLVLAAKIAATAKRHQVTTSAIKAFQVNISLALRRGVASSSRSLAGASLRAAGVAICDVT